MPVVGPECLEAFNAVLQAAEKPSHVLCGQVLVIAPEGYTRCVLVLLQQTSRWSYPAGLGTAIHRRAVRMGAPHLVLSCCHAGTYNTAPPLLLPSVAPAPESCLAARGW
jgi:hypothetical protein